MPLRRCHLACALILGLLAAGARADMVRTQIAPGVEFMQDLAAAPPTGPLVVNALRIDLRAPGVRVQAAIGQDVVLTTGPSKGRERVGSLAVRHGALAAVNADFFPFTGDPLGITVRDGELLSEPAANRAAMGFTADGAVVFDTLLPVGTLAASDGATAGIDGLNRPVSPEQIILETPAFGDRIGASSAATVAVLNAMSSPIRAGRETTAVVALVAPGEPAMPIPPGGAVLVGSRAGGEWLRAHLRIGDTVRVRFDLVANPLPAGPPRGSLASRAASLRGRVEASAWPDVVQAVGGGPWLVRDGRPAVDAVEEGFPEREFAASRHPRTAAGVTARGELLLVTVDGRQEFSRGMTLDELARRMVALGAVQAINLDGGGSTTMTVQGAYVNGPSDGEPRPVASALLVFAGQPSGAADSPAPAAATGRVAPAAVIARAGERTQLHAPEGSASRDAVWGTVDGKAFVDQAGRLFSTRAGSGTAVMVSGSGRTEIPYVVVAGRPARLRAVLAASPNNPPDRNILRVTVTDRYGNPLAGQPVSVRVSGGMADTAAPRTDASGRAETEIVWDALTGRKAVVGCPGLPDTAAR